MFKIGIAEDDTKIASLLKSALEENDYQVTLIADGIEALSVFTAGKFDLLILDVMMPGLNGHQLCERIRVVDQQIPILMLTALGMVDDKVNGLEAGADDYLVKPFNLEELILRVGILVKRSLKSDDLKELNSYKIGDKTIYFNSFELKQDDGVVVPLTKKETMLLKLLIERKNEAVSREQILETVWNYDVYPSTRTIDNFILTFRKYFEPDQKNPVYFHSIRGVGYKFTDIEH